MPGSCSRTLLPALLLGLSATTLQGFEPGIEEVLEGFDNGPEKTPTSETEESVGSRAPAGEWLLSGELILSTSYNYAHKAPDTGKTDYRGLSRLRSKVNLELDGIVSQEWSLHLDGHLFYDLSYAIKGRDRYTDEGIDAYEQETELGEAYLQGSLGPDLDLKLGRQIVVWGKSDNLRATDLLNPLDQRELGRVDIEDLRLPVNMIRLDYYTGPWTIGAIAIPEVRFSKTPVKGSDFFPAAAPLPPEEVPRDGRQGLDQLGYQDLRR